MTIIQLFDYAALDVADRTYIEIREGQIKGLLRNTARNIIDTGKLLAEVKDRLEHGQFMTWCEQRFGWSLRTAERYMAVADKF
ncbi:MAG: DUF3102 domain-containing protein, partial [Chloroflexi bacterium]|nr:DUF3102 domain-containing protein [Chloroflexota bacterium]